MHPLNLERATSCLLSYLESSIRKICMSVEQSLTDEQIKVINGTPENELLVTHWEANKITKKDPFESR